MFQVIDNKLNDHMGRHRRFDGRTVTQCMPGAPVLQRGFIGACRVARGAFMEEGGHGVFGFLGQTLRIFQCRRRRREQRRERERRSQKSHLRCSVGGAESLCKLMLILVLVVSWNDNDLLSSNRANTTKSLLPQLEKSSFI